MQPVLTVSGQTYLETQIFTKQQMADALKLCNNFLYWKDEEDKITKLDIEEFLQDEQDGACEAWLLYTREQAFSPRINFNPSPNEIPPYSEQPSPFIPADLNPLENFCHYASRYYPTTRTTLVPVAFVLISPYDQSYQSLMSLDCFCRDPWADTAACVEWADSKLMQCVGVIKGVDELRVVATESDTPLQRELRKQGYFCFEYKQESGELGFGKILRLRPREHALKPLFPKPQSMKRKRG